MKKKPRKKDQPLRYGEARSVIVQARLTKAQAKRLTQAAKAHGLTRSAMVALILERAEIPAPE